MNGVILTKTENLNGKSELTKSEPRVNFASSSSRSVFVRSDSRLNQNKIPRHSSIGKSSRVKMWLKKVGHQVSLSNRQARGSPLTATSVLSLPVINSSPGNVSSRSPTVEDPSQIQEETFVDTCTDDPPRYTFTRHAIRSNYMDKSIEAKKKVIRMLFVVVAEFFVCWAPLHVMNTWYLFSPEFVYQTFGSTGVSLVQLLAYISSCCNPITYCFMNRKFRQAFLNVFHCYRYCLSGADTNEAGIRSGNIPGAPNNSEISGNDSTVYVGRIVSTLNRSEIVVLEAEDRV